MLARLKSIPWLPLIVGLSVLRLIAGATMNLVPDEAYYWLWAQHPAAGYYDHPPMVAWWIWASTAVFGDSALAVRLPFIFSFLGVCWLAFDAAKALFSAEVARRTVLWLNACLLLSAGSVMATPDPPSVLMWTGGLWALARLLASGQGRYWLVFGLFAGLGVEAKYTNLFLGAGVVAWLIADRPARSWLTTPWPYAGAAIALLAMAPNLLWNLHHDWQTVIKQFGRIGASHVTLNFLIELLLSQPLLLNPLILAFTFLGVLAAFQAKDSRLRLLVALPLPLLAYLLLHVFHDRVQGNWTAPVFPGLVLLGAVIAEGIAGDAKLERARWLAAPVGIGLSVVVLGGMIVTSFMQDVSLPSSGWRRVTEDIAATHEGSEAQWVATTDYNTQGELSFYTPARNAGVFVPYAMAERQRYPWQGAPPQGRAIIVIAKDKAIDPATCFSDVRDLGEVYRNLTSGKKTTFELYEGTLKDPACDINPTAGRR